MGTLRSSELEILLDGCEWHRVNVTLDETAITLSPINGLHGEVPLVPLQPSQVITSEKRFVRIIKPEGSGLGISIQGGSDNSRPIVISKVFSGMAADHQGLYVGDVILAVNGESLINAKHDEAVRALKRAGKVVNLQGIVFLIKGSKKLVQYKRDVHLKKDNVLQRLSWDDEEQVDSRDCSRSFGLKLAFVTRQKLQN